MRRSATGLRSAPSPSWLIASSTTCSASHTPPGLRRRRPTAHVDLHCHSTASDGECPPGEAARRAHAAGLARIALDDVHARAGVGALGRRHVARALVDCGASDDISDAFTRYLGRGRPAYVEKPLPTLADVMTLVHAVGGVAVAAHLGDHGTEGQIRQFQAHGPDGREVP